MLSKRSSLKDDKIQHRPNKASKRQLNTYPRHLRTKILYSEDLVPYCSAWVNGDAERQIMGNLASKFKQKRNYAPAKFPFQSLPQICKLRIFTFLDITDKGRAAQVCQEWNVLMKSSRLWNSVDLTLLISQHCQNMCLGATEEVCHEKSIERLNKFHKHLSTIRPVLKELRFALDLFECFDVITSLLEFSQCKELKYANLDWRPTPTKSIDLGMREWEESMNGSDILYQTHLNCRLRQRRFGKFISLFVEVAPNVTHLALPFEWSLRSVEALTMLTRLERLQLEKYLVFQHLDQSLLDKLISSLPSLKHLNMEVWTPDARGGLACYQMSSTSLETLDISKSRGLYLSSVKFPKLTEFNAVRRPWTGPIVNDCDPSIPCIYYVLSAGCPRLRKFNGHVLREDWKENIYEDLGTVLKDVCSCSLHKKGWVM
jgi:hypothetical protein